MLLSDLSTDLLLGESVVQVKSTNSRLKAKLITTNQGHHMDRWLLVLYSVLGSAPAPWFLFS